MTVQALHEAGGVAYLRTQAVKNPSAFLALIAKCMPLVVKHDASNLEIIVKRLVMPDRVAPGVIGSPVRQLTVVDNASAQG